MLALLRGRSPLQGIGVSSLLVRNVGQLMTLAGPQRPRVGPEMSELGLINQAAMLVTDGKVAAVGPASEVETQAPTNCDEVDAKGALVTPGFVDAHTHPVFAGHRADEFAMRCAGRSYREIAEQGGGILSTVRATRAATEDELLAAAQRHARWFQQCGTTTIEGKSGYGLDLDSELKQLRVIKLLGTEAPLRVQPTVLAAHAIPPEFKEDPERYVACIIDEILPAVAAAGLAKSADAFCESIAFSIDQVRRIGQAATALGFELRLHIDQLGNSGGAALAAELRAKTADHCEFTDEPGMHALLAAEITPVLLPISVFALGHARYPDARRMIDLGLPVVVATDFNPGSSPSPSMPLAMSLASLFMGMSPAEAWVASTVNAAYSLGLGHTIGSLQPGYAADFVIWDAEHPNEIPYHPGLNLAKHVFVAGVPVSP